MALPIKKLSQITEETGLFIIKAKVIYAWKSIEDGGKGTALHMLLLDEESTTIQATIAHYNYNQFGSRIIEGSTYSLSNFKLFNVNLMVMLVHLQPSHFLHKINSNALSLGDVVLGDNGNLICMQKNFFVIKVSLP
ncbi:unnamed protein product [Amaranthus hypochondriacus]